MSKKSPPSQHVNKNHLIIYGKHPVFAAIANPKRQINKILTTTDNANELKAACLKAKRTPDIVTTVDRKEIDKLFPTETAHQGFALFCSRLASYSIEDVIEMSSKLDKCHVLILDQVTDPQNIGTIIRSAVAFNTLAIIMQDKNSPLESGAMDKAAVGAIEHMPIVRVTNLSRAIEQLKKADFWSIGMDGYATTTLDKINKSGKTAIIMGSEGKGMRRLIEESCDISVKLQISPLTESLNVATAASIALYEINKE